MGLKNLRGGQPPAAARQQQDPMQISRQLGQNTGSMMQQVGLNVPQGLNGNGQGAMDHLLKSGQISQQQYDQAFQFARRLLGKR